MDVNIIESLKDRHGNRILFAAKEADEAETNRLSEAYQEMWDNKQKFTGHGLSALTFSKRKEDTEEELGACADALYKALQNIVYVNWINSLSRDEAVHLCNVLFSLQKFNQGSFVVAGHNLESFILAQEWSKSHPDQEKIYGPDTYQQ